MIASMNTIARWITKYLRLLGGIFLSQLSSANPYHRRSYSKIFFELSLVHRNKFWNDIVM